MRDMCLRALDLVKPEEAGRRVVTLLNDSDAGRENVAVCGWLFSGMQAMRPGEITPAHKHTASAHRFIMEGRGAYTVVDGHPRSEEHTSELQSLMRISYAVFCLKKKNKH